MLLLKKMAGQMGNKRVTVQNLEVIATDPEDQILVVKGAIPGAKGSYIELKDSHYCNFNNKTD